MSAGFSEHGFAPVLATDLDQSAIATYNTNVANCGVVAPVSEIRREVRANLLLAGPPCQGFSTLGRRDPRDQRNRLCLYVVGWAEAVKAEVVVVENVPQFLTSPHWKRMVLGLERLGYEIAIWNLDAADFGCPQRRLRAFTIASKIGLPSQPRKRNGRATAGDVLDRKLRNGDLLHVWPTHEGIARARIQLVPAGGDKRDIMMAAPDICPPSWFKVGCQATDVWGRMLPDEPANTIRCDFQNPSKGRYIHPREDRVISLREGARLQGVDDAWEFSGYRSHISRQIGNGVPIPLAAAVASRVRTLFF